MGVAGETGEAIEKTVEQLEAYVAAEDAAAAAADNGGEVSEAIKSSEPTDAAATPDVNEVVEDE